MLEIASKVESVRVGRRQAEVVRTLAIPGEALARAGATPLRVRVGGLPIALDDGSVRVSAAADSGLRVRSMRVTLVAPNGRREEGDDAALTAVSDAKLVVDRLQSELAVWHGSLAALQAMPRLERPRARRGEPPLPSPTESRVARALFERERAEKLSREIARVDRELEEARTRLSVATATHERSSTARAPLTDELRKALVIDLEPIEGSSAATALSVSYVVAGARWMPAYTLRIARGAASLELRALVQQNTGEDWERVRVSLSTAEIDRAHELPELQSIRVGRAQAAPKRSGFRAPPHGAVELYADYLRALTKSRDARAPEPATETRHAEADANEWSREAAPRDTGASFDELGDSFGGEATAAAIALPSGPPLGGFAPGSAGRADMGRPSDQLRAMTLTGGGGAAQKPLAQAAPMPQAHSMTRSMGAPKSRMLRFKGAPTPARGSVANAAPPAPIEDEPSLDRGLAFASMRMPPPGVGASGKLVRLGPEELYVEAARDLAPDRESAGFAAIVRGALAATRALAAPPSRYSLAESYAGFDFSFDADGAVDVPSDGEPHAIALTTLEADAKITHVVVPRESRDVFRVVEVASPLDAPLLTGPLDVYEDGDFLISTDLPTTAPKGILKVGLGVDSAVKVARNIDYSETITGLMRGSLELWHKVTTEVVNARADKIRLDVRERVPTTLREKDIKVEVIRVEPMWKGYEDEQHPITGAHVWQLALGPGEKRSLALEYVVHIASKNELAGGNRREA